MLKLTKQTFLLAAIFIGILVVIALLVLFITDQLSPPVLKAVVFINALITFIVAIWKEQVQQYVPAHWKGIWTKANRPAAFGLAMAVMVVLAVGYLLFSLLALDPYQHKGYLALNDPLTSNNLDHGWDETSYPTSHCLFTGQSYDVEEATPDHSGNITYCRATNTEFSRFIYEVQLTIVRGSFGGITFTDEINNNCYYFGIGQQSHFTFVLYEGCKDQPTIDSTEVLAPSEASSIHLHPQNNLIAVAVDADHIYLYINNVQVGNEIIPTGSYNHGQIGVFAQSSTDQPGATEVIFKNARVWQW